MKTKKNKQFKYFPCKTNPKVLVLDIETSPILGFVWSLWMNNVALNQIDTDWHILSFAAKWLSSPEKEVMYMDQRNAKDIEDDSELLQEVWKLLDEADIVIGQNSKNFDIRKLNARFILNDFQPPSSFKQIDTKIIASKQFMFTSNKLEYLSDKLCTKYKKIKHEEFGGFELWSEVLKGNLDAWKEMERYNRHDVLSTGELYQKLSAWDSNAINFALYTDEEETVCQCGCHDFVKNGFYYTQVSKFQKYKCKSCGAETRSRINLFSKDKRKSLRIGTNK